MRLVYILMAYSSILSSQDHLDVFIQDVLHGSRDSATIYLPTLEQKYPNNPSLLYLKGLLETDGDNAKDIFTKLYNNHPANEYGDDAVMKVAEYYYAAGLYIQAGNWLKKMPIYYSRSEHIERAVKLFLNALIVSGHRDTAIFYSRVFERQFPDLDVDGKINDLLEDFQKSAQEKENDKKKQSPYDESEKDSNIETDNKKQVIKQSNNKSVEKFSLQTGAFSSRENAESQKINLIIAGFKARVKKLYRNDRTLYAVRIGYYNSKDDAEVVSVQVKKKLDIDSITITNN